MTVPSYTTDLQTVSLAEAIGTWVEIPSRKGGGAATLEDRAYIQGAYSISQSTGAATGKTVGLQFDYGGNIASWVSGWAIFVWQYWQAPFAIDTWANGGMRIGIGSGSGDVDLFNAQGNDYGRNPYGGFANVAIDPEYAGGYDERVGTPTAGNYRYFWSAPNLLLAVSKGNPHCVDAVRYGRGELIIEYGEVADYCTFIGLAAKNDNNEATNGYNRWGLFQAQGVGYLWKGLISLGTSSNAVDFRDSNRNITVEDTPRTYAAFNRIEIVNAGSNVEWTGVNITTLNPSGLSIGQFEMVDNATVLFTICVFTDMSTFIFQSNADVLGCTFRRCALITGAGGVFTGSTIDESVVAADASAFGWNVALDPDGYLDDMTFAIGGNAHHAIEFGTTSPLTMTVRGMTATGFNAANGQNDSTFHVLRDTGTVTINIIGGTGNFSYKTAGATVNIVVDPVTLVVTVIDVNKDPIENAQTSIHLLESPYTELMNEDTTALGVATESYNYTSDVDVVVRVRKSDDLDDPRYVAFSSVDTIKSTGLGLTVTLKEQPLPI